MQYIVKRQHYGDKQYYAGDTRTITNKQDAQKLIDMGLIAEAKISETKAAPKPQNKMVKETINKAES